MLVFKQDKYKKDTDKFTTVSQRQFKLQKLEKADKLTKSENNEF